MADLRSLCTSLGFANVRTYIQSGNVVFESTSRPSEAALKQAIARRFDVAPEVVVLSATTLIRVVQNVPFATSETAHLHVGFAIAPIADSAVSSAELDRFVPERCAISGAVIYLNLPNGMGNAKLPAFLDRRVGYPVTYRNWATLNKLMALTSEPSQPSVAKRS